MLFDSHAHYNDERFDQDREALLEAMASNGVTGILNVGYDLPSSEQCIAFAQKYPFIYAAVGVHPHDAKTLTPEGLQALERLCTQPKVVALGEIGLDYHYDNSPREVQKHWYREQLRCAKRLGLPVIIHDREAHQDCFDIVQEEQVTRGVFHSFSGSVEMAKELIKLGFHLSISGPVTFKNAHKLVDVAAWIPLDRLLIETDCPYLTPEPFRGKRNDSTLLIYTAHKIADIKGISLEELAQATMQNTKQLFSIE